MWRSGRLGLARSGGSRDDQRFKGSTVLVTTIVTLDWRSMCLFGGMDIHDMDMSRLFFECLLHI
jgi:hypothetical protein